MINGLARWLSASRLPAGTTSSETAAGYTWQTPVPGLADLVQSAPALRKTRQAGVARGLFFGGAYPLELGG